MGVLCGSGCVIVERSSGEGVSAYVAVCLLLDSDVSVCEFGASVIVVDSVDL